MSNEQSTQLTPPSPTAGQESSTAENRLAELREQRGINPEQTTDTAGNVLSRGRKKLSPDELASLRKQREADEKARLEDFGRQRIRAALINAGCPRRHVERQCSDLQGEEWNATCDGLRSMLGSLGVCLVIGDRGRGKTQLGVELIRAKTQDGTAARYVKLSDLYREIRSTYSKASEVTETGLMTRYRNYPLLVIDAIEVRLNTENEDLVLNDLVDKRYDDGTDTVLIGNTTEDEIQKSLGTSIVTRANETGGVIVCDWQSYREVKA